MRQLTRKEQETARILDITESKPHPKMLPVLHQILMFRALLMFFIPESQRKTIFDKEPKKPEVEPTTINLPKKKRGKVYLARKLRERRAKGKARQVGAGDEMRKTTDSTSCTHPLRNMMTAADLGLAEDE